MRRALLAESAEQTLRIELPDHPLFVEGDETRLIQVVGNLIKTRSIFRCGRDDCRLGRDQRGYDRLLRVRDRGRGISQELLPRVLICLFRGAECAESVPGLALVWHWPNR